MKVILGNIGNATDFRRCESCYSDMLNNKYRDCIYTFGEKGNKDFYYAKTTKTGMSITKEIVE